MISSTAMRNVLLNSVQLGGRFFAFGRGVVHLDRGAGPQRSKRFVASNDDFVAVFQTAGNFNIGHTRDTRLHWNELCLLFAYDENSLNIGLLGIAIRP